jgi:4-amino-4-deoxy-L-arabinose transferase-like glycosyltransferase
MFLVRIFYLASRTILLSEDESYQWLWSKHLALSYYSKPLLIAVTQRMGTALWGDTELGIRFFAPVISTILGVMILRFFAREVNARAGFFLLLILAATPLMAVGGILMTIDPLSVLFWSAAMFAGWRAIQPGSHIEHWLWVGLYMGLGFLSKYTALLQLVSWVIFFCLWQPARLHLRRGGPWLALLLNGLLTLPVVIWNAQHQWITVRHVAETGGTHKPWRFTLKFIGDFLGSELGLLNPVFFVAAIWAAIVFWRKARHNPRLIYFFSMSAPVFLFYLLWTLRSRVLPNWIAPGVLPLFILMVIFWDTEWRLREGSRVLQGWLITGLLLGFLVVVVGHNTDLVKKVTGHYLPVNLDPLHRVRGGDALAAVVGQAREEFQAEGKPVFIIGDHYGLVGEISFYLPEARAAVSGEPLVFYPSSSIPRNQFFFWPGYGGRKGQNALYLHELDRSDPRPIPPPARLVSEFESVSDFGVRNVYYHGRVLRPLQIFACRNLR